MAAILHGQGLRHQSPGNLGSFRGWFSMKTILKKCSDLRKKGTKLFLIWKLMKTSIKIMIMADVY